MVASIQNLFQSLQKVKKVSAPPLSSGNVVNGKVEDLLPKNHAVVDIGGRKIHARLETSLTKGKTYMFQVQSQKDPVHLKVLSNQAGEETLPLQKWMKAHGIKANSHTVMFTKMLMDNQLPFHAKDLKQAIAIMQASKNAKAPMIVKEMFEKQLPIRNSVFQALAAGKDNRLHTLFQQLSNGGDPFEPSSRASILLRTITSVKGTTGMQSIVNQKLLNEVQKGEDRSFHVLKQAGVLPSGETFETFKSKLVQPMPGSPYLVKPEGTQPIYGQYTSPMAQGRSVVLDEMAQRLPITSAFYQGGTASKNGPFLLNDTSAGKIQALFDQQVPLSGKEAQKLSQWLTQVSRIFNSKAAGPPSDALLHSFKENHQQLTGSGTFQKLIASLSEMEKSSIRKVLSQMPVEAGKYPDRPSEGMVRMIEAVTGRFRQTLAEQVPPSLKKTLTEWAALTSEGMPRAVRDKLLLQVKAFQQLSGLDDEAMMRQSSSSPEASMKTGLLSLLSDGTISKAEMARNLLHVFNSIQLNASQETVQSAQFTLQFPGQLLDAEGDIHVNIEGKKKEEGGIDPDHCHILFYLELEQLKETVIDLQVRDRRVDVTVINEEEHLPEISKMFEEKLESGLEQNGYTLGYIQVKEGRANTTKRETDLRTIMASQGVDFRI